MRRGGQKCATRPSTPAASCPPSPATCESHGGPPCFKHLNPNFHHRPAAHLRVHVADLLLCLLQVSLGLLQAGEKQWQVGRDNTQSKRQLEVTCAGDWASRGGSARGRDGQAAFDRVPA